jgi:hypothetical protein
MNSRAEGAFEAVSYVREFARKHSDRANFPALLERELDALIDDISAGIAVDFRFKLRNLS